MAAVLWLLQHASDVPEADDWLSPAERRILAGFWAPKRVRDWRLGRWTGKRALARAGVAQIGEADMSAWARLSIVAAQSGSPRVLLAGVEIGWAISLSHSGEYGLCAIAGQPAAIGCDIETTGRRAEEFVLDYFSDAERRMVAAVAASGARSPVVTVVWSAKESAVKALGVGLRLDTREVEVELPAGAPGCSGWHPMVVYAQDRGLRGWWRTDDDRVMTIVADPPPALPTDLLA